MELSQVENVLPMEIWCEIGIMNKDYDIYRTLRSLNKCFNKAVSGVDIKGRFDYVYESKDGNFDPRMLALFRQLVVIDTSNREVAIYKNQRIVRAYTQHLYDDTVYIIASLSRFADEYVRSEIIRWDVDGSIRDYSRCETTIAPDGEDYTCLDVYEPRKRKVRHYSDDMERLTFSDFQIWDDFFLYDPIDE
jgi:hypothetical protein